MSENILKISFDNTQQSFVFLTLIVTGGYTDVNVAYVSKEKKAKTKAA